MPPTQAHWFTAWIKSSSSYRCTWVAELNLAKMASSMLACPVARVQNQAVYRHPRHEKNPPLFFFLRWELFTAFDRLSLLAEAFVWPVVVEGTGWNGVLLRSCVLERGKMADWRYASPCSIHASIRSVEAIIFRSRHAAGRNIWHSHWLRRPS